MVPASLIIASFATIGASFSDDAVLSLPTYGKPKSKQYAGFAPVTLDGKNKLHYWFAECDEGNQPGVTPFLMWLNGGPGASSLTGFLAEKLGPVSILANATLVDNPDRITKKYHLLTLDNPVGAGYSSTSSGAYVTSEAQMRTQAVQALRVFFERHPEYAHNPFWVTGESYAGHYVPNIAWELAVNASEIPLQGVFIGNGMYNMRLQYPTVGPMAHAAGVIDDATRDEMGRRQDACVKRIAAAPATAGAYCENVTVYWLFSDRGAGELFYYDVGLSDATFFDDLTAAMSAYLNRADVKAAVHAEGAQWVQADEKGPVAAALLPDWAVDSDVTVATLLGLGYAVHMYNGVRDLSSCNHLGNEAVLEALCRPADSPCAGYAAARPVPWPSAKRMEGYMKRRGNLTYSTVLRTGHLVPTVVPEAFATLLGLLIPGRSRGGAHQGVQPHGGGGGDAAADARSADGAAGDAAEEEEEDAAAPSLSDVPREIPIAPCGASAATSSYALLFRGEMYRSGCDARGAAVQVAMMRAYHRLVGRSLMACGATVEVFFTDDARGCANATLRAQLERAWGPPPAPAGDARAAIRRHWLPVTARTQPQGMRAALAAYAPHAAAFDSVVILRYDVRVLQPLRAWPCYSADRAPAAGLPSGGTIGLASRCEAWSWRTWNCTNDQLFVVPTARLAAFRDALGEDLGVTVPEDAKADTTCFAGDAAGDGVARRGYGHGCYNALARRVGSEQLRFCWPARREGALERNDYFRRWRHSTWSAW